MEGKESWWWSAIYQLLLHPIQQRPNYGELGDLAQHPMSDYTGVQRTRCLCMSKRTSEEVKVMIRIDVVLMRLTRELKQHEASGINKEELLVNRNLQGNSKMGVYSAMLVSTVLLRHDS